MIYRICDEIKKCIDNECFIAALSLALTLPDICGKAEFPDKGNTTRYITWYNDFIGKNIRPNSPYGDDMPYLSGEMLYNLRNSVLHQGELNVNSNKIKEERCKVGEFVITIADCFDLGTSYVAYGAGFSITQRALEVNLIQLCSMLCRAAKEYYSDNVGKFDFIKYKLVDQRGEYDSLFTEN